MTDEPDLSKRQEQILWALVAQQLAADIDPTEAGGLANDGLAQQLGVATQRRLRNHIAQLTAMGYRVTIEPAA
jgi:hypothetical protein